MPLVWLILGDVSPLLASFVIKAIHEGLFMCYKVQLLDEKVGKVTGEYLSLE